METRLHSSEFTEDLEIAISGGGFRATAFGLGVLLYLVHSGLNQHVKTITSVSGGSITNGFVANECDFSSSTEDEFRRVAARLARIISGKGRVHGFWLVSRPYLMFLFASGVIILVWFITMFVALLALLFWGVEHRPVSSSEVMLFSVVALIWNVAALLMGELVLRWIANSFFCSNPITLGSLSDRRIDHVFCATDLTSSGPFFFSTKGGGRVFSEIYGRGEGKDIPLKMAVAASAAFPPLVPPMRLKLLHRRLILSDSSLVDNRISEGLPNYVYLSDGGVWNNLATDWSRLRSVLGTAEMAWMKIQGLEEIQAVQRFDSSCPMGGVLLIANASQPERRKNLWTLKVPVLSLLLTLIRVVNVTVNSTVRARSVDIERTARLRMLNDPDRWELGDDAVRPKHTIWGENRGTDNPLAVVMEMTRKPGDTAIAYKMIGGLKQWAQRPDEYADELEKPLEKLKPLLKGDDIIPTTLDNLGPRRTLRMIVLGYLNTRETLAVAFANHTPPPIPSREWFEELLESKRFG